MKKYYVIYKSKDIGYYETIRYVICAVEDEDVAKDFCKKFKAYYTELTVGEDDAPHGLEIRI